ncbi:nucleolar protein dao-5 [Scaptodrosophila lebanonensis]|uniref:Nucleolar protein dao-5 n=1 Tax=Drosophila lebanonensis TaxID=7225 RepID=A0A6J2T818_DROLE|nr:nucleolar protein dao-5 [Scaptodrosophila lebanonensis]
MKRAKSWLFMAATVLLLSVLASTDAALPFKKVSIAKNSASTTTTTTSTTTGPTEAAGDDEEAREPSNDTDEGKSTNSTLSTKDSKLTGIPQIDYIWDPNLPRELRGYNLSSYPFLSTVPTEDDIHFKCEGLHDGFYASIEYKCQVYHHCVYGIRHDFLCANFTAFDQRTFICHFVSDVDCEGSQKYWNRNDELYMATTTTSTSTTTTEPPPTPRRSAMRPRRPLRRPYNRRPIDDYYYDEEEYDDDYYEERLNRRHKPRPRQRKPVDLDYDDEYDDKRSEEKPRRSGGRNRYRGEDDLDDDYEDRRNRQRARPGKAGATAERRKTAGSRKPARGGDERRSFTEERLGRRRSNEKRPTPSTSAALDELDDYERPYGVDQEEAAEEDAPQKIKTTPKPLEEFITPKAAPSSVFSRPRAPPRIARPVPINEKKKYEYPVQKSTATTSAPSASLADDDDYYQQQPDEDYEQPPARNTARRRTAAPSDLEEVPVKRRNQKPTRPTLRKPATSKQVLLEDEDYDNERYETRRKRPLAVRTRKPAPDLDFVDPDYEEHERVPPARATAQRLRPKVASARKPVPRPRQPIIEEDQQLESDLESADEEPLAPAAPPKTLTAAGRTASVRVVKRPFLPSRGGSPYLPRGLQPVGVALRPLIDSRTRTTDSTPIDMGSTISGVRLLEHGAPLLRDAGSYEDFSDQRVPAPPSPPSPTPPRTTLPPRSALPTVSTQKRPEPPQPKVNLDELYENDYDVTLNDALDPTLKPLTPQHQHQHQLQSYSRPYQQQQQHAPSSAASAFNPFAHNNYQQAHLASQSASASASAPPPEPPNYHSDSYFSSTDIRRRAIVPAQVARSNRHEYSAARGAGSQVSARIAQHFYDDFTY